MRFFTPYKRRRKREIEYESEGGKKRKVLSVKEENSNPESESEDNMDPKINNEWSSGQPYVQIKNHLGEELVVTTAPAEEQTSTIHVEQPTAPDRKSRFSVGDNATKKSASDNGNVLIRKLEEVSHTH